MYHSRIAINNLFRWCGIMKNTCLLYMNLNKLKQSLGEKIAVKYDW